MLNSPDLNDSHHANTNAIGLFEDLAGQTRLKEAYEHLLKADTGIVGKFFNILNAFTDREDIKSCEIAENALVDFFAQLNIDFRAGLSDITQLTAHHLENDLQRQQALYLLCYTHLNLNVSSGGKITTKYVFDDQSQKEIEAVLMALEDVQFGPAYYMHTKLSHVDPDHTPTLMLQGARLGNIESRYAYVARYLSHLAGTAIMATPPAFEFPEGIDQQIMIAWIKETKNTGYTAGVSNIQNFISNVFGALGAIHQPPEKQVTDAQKARLIEMAELVKAISDDKKVNKAIDTILNMDVKNKSYEEIKEKYLQIVKEADQYLSEQYSTPLKRTPLKIEQCLFDGELNAMQMQMEQERSRLQALNSATANIFNKPIEKMEKHRAMLLNAQDQKETKKVLGKVKANIGLLHEEVKEAEEVSHSFRAFMKRTANKIKNWLYNKFNIETEKSSLKTPVIVKTYDMKTEANKLLKKAAMPPKQSDKTPEHIAKKPKHT
ncbi:hypothetical protein CC99x_011410 [Candidatus Berkiella cookevillensis]|uniref:Uncharacterized protein n=1 Tax=Candidatus Berkiella cookevillensis TaxID=437022 RepID=A0A0Q9YRR1_9GAMM|nr:hypothetical protein [Candidatus Berkiella cookevillensis]MCS5709502.1 hypothetical protein [Candidatus Berkiella cookevillensis]